MALTKVKKGRHYPSWKLRHTPLFYIFKRNFKWTKHIKFTKESFFQFEGDDIFDYSKLFGISFLHHRLNESYRFGFRMLNSKNINLSLYQYINGKRTIENICDINYNKIYTFEIKFIPKTKIIQFKIDCLNTTIYKKMKVVNNFKWLGYKLGLYIGGNQTVGKDILIEEY